MSTKAMKEMAHLPCGAKRRDGIGHTKRKRPLARRSRGADRIFSSYLYTLGLPGRPPQFVVELYPYANLAHTMRLRQETAHVRLSDILRDAPVAVIELPRPFCWRKCIDAAAFGAAATSTVSSRSRIPLAVISRVSAANARGASRTIRAAPHMTWSLCSRLSS